MGKFSQFSNVFSVKPELKISVQFDRIIDSLMRTKYYFGLVLVLFVPHSWVSGFTQQAIVRLTGDPRYLRFSVLIREDAKGVLQ